MEGRRGEALARAQAVIRADADAITATLDCLDDGFAAAAQAIATCAGKVLVTGSGTSGAVSIRAAHLLSVGGTPAFHLAPADGLHGGLGVLQKGDIVLALSKGGSSRELNEFCTRARTLAGTLIVITAAPQSDLAAMADHVICMKLPDGTDLGGIVATGSSLAAAALTDALVEMARVARGYSWEQVLFTHPSGAVGRDAARSLADLNDKSEV